jgi:hypothetical protein
MRLSVGVSVPAYASIQPQLEAVWGAPYVLHCGARFAISADECRAMVEAFDLAVRP